MARSLKHLTRNLDHEEPFKQAFERLKDLSPREAAIVGAQLLETTLERRLLFRFKHLKNKEISELFDGTGPLSSFSSKIKVAYAVGSIDAMLRNDLNKVREVRNAFAHSILDLDFTVKEIGEIVLSIEYFNKAIATPLGQTFLYQYNIDDMKQRFSLSCQFLRGALWIMVDPDLPANHPGLKPEPPQ